MQLILAQIPSPWQGGLVRGKTAAFKEATFGFLDDPCCHAAMLPCCHGAMVMGWDQAIDFAQSVGIDKNMISKAEAKLQEHKVWLHFGHAAGHKNNLAFEPWQPCSFACSSTWKTPESESYNLRLSPFRSPLRLPSGRARARNIHRGDGL